MAFLLGSNNIDLHCKNRPWARFHDQENTKDSEAIPLCKVMNSSNWVETMSMDGSLYISGGYRLEFPNKDVLQTLT